MHRSLLVVLVLLALAATLATVEWRAAEPLDDDEIPWNWESIIWQSGADTVVVGHWEYSIKLPSEVHWRAPWPPPQVRRRPLSTMARLRRWCEE